MQEKQLAMTGKNALLMLKITKERSMLFSDAMKTATLWFLVLRNFEVMGEDKTVRRNGQHENKLCQEARTVSISGTFQGWSTKLEHSHCLARGFWNKTLTSILICGFIYGVLLPGISALCLSEKLRYFLHGRNFWVVSSPKTLDRSQTTEGSSR